MSWIKTVVEVSGKAGLGRVRRYAGAVVHQAGQAVTNGARILQNQIGNHNHESFKYDAKKLEEAAVSSKGEDRVELLKRWLTFLSDIETVPNNSSLAQFYGTDKDCEPMNFRDVFIQSQALEGMTMSMILEEPNDEEAFLLEEIFRFSLKGATEVHNGIISKIKSLATAFSSYEDEVLVKREELLQFAQCAISGLKLNTDLARIDTEASILWQRIYGLEGQNIFTNKMVQKTSMEKYSTTIEALEQVLEEVQLCLRLEELLSRKNTIKSGDTLMTHCEKVSKLKVLAESLANSSSKAETRISNHRHQLEDALSFRVAKVSEAAETEKGLIAEISRLQSQRVELEAELNKVNVSLNAALGRLHKHGEERNHFNEASNQIILQLKAKEDELSRSVASCKIEAHVVRICIDFLEDTWLLRSSYLSQKEKETNHELDKYRAYFVKLIKQHLLECKNELGVSVNLIKALAYNLTNFTERENESTVFTKVFVESNSQEILEQEYLQVERKIITALVVVDHLKELFYAEQSSYRRADDQIKELFNWIEKSKEEFGAIARPNLKNEISREWEEKLQESTFLSAISFSTPTAEEAQSPVSSSSSSSFPGEPQQMHSAADLAKLDSDCGSSSTGHSSEEISGWEL